MKNVLTDIRHVIKPLRWFLVFQFIIFLVLIVLPQGNDIYVNLFEDGFWENKMPTGLIFISLIFICSTSGIGTKFLTAIHPIQENDPLGNYENRKEVLKWVVNFLWYFPLIVFVIGFIKAATLNYHLFALSGIVWTLIFSVGTFKVIQKIRFLLRKYLYLGIKRQILTSLGLSEEDKARTSTEELMKNFDSLHSIFPDEIQTAREKLNFIRDNYNPLLKILAGIFTWSILLSIIFALLPIEHYHKIGAVALVIFGMGSWITFFYCIEIFDKIYKISLPLPEKFQILNLKSIIFFWFCFCSFRANHQVRQMENIPTNNITENTIDKNLDKFYEMIPDDSKPKDSSYKIPLIFVDVDGGASRTGLFGALMLSTITDSTSNFKNQIFGYSNISGGTLGANVFMSLDPKKNGKDSVNHSELTKRFFLHDFISPLIGTFMFGELFNYFIPFPVEKFDRGVALEKSWELSWKNMYKENKETTLSEPFQKVLSTSANTSKFTPVMLINSFEIETGKRAILSNIKLEEKVFSGITNLNDFIKRPISYSSAIHLSARFPIVSPTGEVSNSGVTRHYGDGGYFETSGTLTLYELIRSLEDSSKLKQYDVYVIHCQYNADHTEDNKTSNNLFTEFSDIVNGALTVRSGFTKFSTENLKNYINKKMGSGHYIELNVGNNDKDVPLNWVMSKKAVEIVQERCIYHLKNNPNLINLLKTLEDYENREIQTKLKTKVPTIKNK
jgi:hypothetical protein